MAAATLAAAGCGGAVQVDDAQRVVKGLASSSAARRIEAARLVPGIGRVPAESVDPLFAMLGEDDPAARRAAAEALGYLDRDAARMERLLAIFRDEKDPVVQSTLREGLERMGVVFKKR